MAASVAAAAAETRALSSFARRFLVSGGRRASERAAAEVPVDLAPLNDYILREWASAHGHATPTASSGGARGGGAGGDDAAADDDDARSSASSDSALSVADLDGSRAGGPDAAKGGATPRGGGAPAPPADATVCGVVVHNVSFRASEDELREAFSAFGEIVEVCCSAYAWRETA